MSEKSKVYFADFRCPSWRENLPQKLARLMMTAGFGDVDMEGKYVAIKMHFGEPGNLAYLRPNWARVVVDLVLSLIHIFSLCCKVKLSRQAFLSHFVWTR